VKVVQDWMQRQVAGRHAVTQFLLCSIHSSVEVEKNYYYSY